MIVGILNQKGGAGKTTLSVNLARSFQKDGNKVLIIDSDPQGSARDWHAASDGSLIPVIGLDRPTLSKDIKSVTNDHDWIFIDGAPQIEEMAVAAIKCSDIVLIPVQPSPYDIWATQDLVDIIKTRQQITDGKPRSAFVVSRQINNTNLGREIRGVLKDYNIPVFKNGTSQRIVYAKTASIGCTVFDTEHNNEAATEINNIKEELKGFLK